MPRPRKDKSQPNVTKLKPKSRDAVDDLIERMQETIKIIKINRKAA